MYEKELKRILNASQNNALTFFVGAGISALSGAPTWKGLINAICDKLDYTKKDAYSSDEYLKIPQMYYYSLGEKSSQYYQFVEEQLKGAELKPNAIHHEMLNLNPVSFITTNYDTLLEDAAIHYCQSFKVITRDEDVPTIFGDRFILKLHGDFKYKNFVLKEEDYLNYSENFKLIETLAKSIFSTNTVVFIGYGLGDYNIKLILNWVKSLLKGNFREPIFVYIGEDDLSDEELVYQKSKGLSVIEWKKLGYSGNDYLNRYQTLFDALRKVSESSLDGKNEDEAFEMLYDLLYPLSRLKALRIRDVSKKLFPYVRISIAGTIYTMNDDSLLFKKFLSINQLAEYEQLNLPSSVYEKYRIIKSVLIKARITTLQDSSGIIYLTTEKVPLADKNCILFDYSSMDVFSKKEYKSPYKKYKKAFYLSRLKRYDESFFLFSEVAKQAFIEGDYLTYYFAESNCIRLSKVIKNINMWHRCYDLNAIESLMPSVFEVEKLFERLPVEFRNTYESLKDIHSGNMLYEYAYDAFIDAQGLQKAIESGTSELGLTSTDKAICRINDYLHFFIENGIFADIFVEYKNTIKNLMSTLMYKYSNQNKKVLHEQPFPSDGSNGIQFDETDFYCFISCFDSKEIIALLNKHHVETVDFRNLNLIEIAVNNLIDYYKRLKKAKKSSVGLISDEEQIKNALVLLRYINISQDLVDKICDFILSQEFSGILIDEKIQFLAYQLSSRKMYSKNTSKIIEDTLIAYIDQHITAIKDNKKFEVPSGRSNIKYCDLVHYIAPFEKPYNSRKLSQRISLILSNKLTPLYSDIVEYYCSYVSEYQKKKLITWTYKELTRLFRFDLFSMLVKFNVRIKSTAKEQLKEFLRRKIKECADDKVVNGVTINHVSSSYKELNQVGYWCLCKRLKARDFKEFLGKSAAFDFYCEYTKFDFSRFDVSWLLYLSPHALKQIAQDPRVKESVRSAIAVELVNKTIAVPDDQRIQAILVKYFC